MKKLELAHAIAEFAHLNKKDAEQFLDAFTHVVATELVKGNKVQLTGFGTFDTTKRSKRIAKHPVTGKQITIPALITPKFKAGNLLKDCLNNR